MSSRPMDPKTYNALFHYKKQLQHSRTIQNLLDQKRSILQSQQTTGAAPEERRLTQMDIKALEQKLAIQKRKLQQAEQNPDLEEVLNKTRVQMEEQQAQPMETAREKCLPILKNLIE